MASPASEETLPPAARGSLGPGEVLSAPTQEVAPARRRIKPYFSVRVNNNGNIYHKKENGGWKHLDNAWWLRKHPHWHWAAEKFSQENGLTASFANVLAAILMPKPAPEDHHLARKKVYQKLAYRLGRFH
jgi:hypothetical protein